jgi:hypothetical protein
MIKRCWTTDPSANPPVNETGAGRRPSTRSPNNYSFIRDETHPAVVIGGDGDNVPTDNLERSTIPLAILHGSDLVTQRTRADVPFAEVSAPVPFANSLREC